MNAETADFDRSTLKVSTVDIDTVQDTSLSVEKFRVLRASQSGDNTSV